ncbi:hypothetical protein SLEP1_g18941 [Rubroshorea leprosula]|uniref:Uncharacterized protein n=1 Tax=Rubroshorea leprosula TaxID=152421 RepID=A0AAV5J557_9ROSI|nr:hypothetical protein SLEP1_g18941 [Rubroshorea leprosula]
MNFMAMAYPKSPEIAPHTAETRGQQGMKTQSNADLEILVLIGVLERENGENSPSFAGFPAGNGWR